MIRPAVGQGTLVFTGRLGQGGAAAVQTVQAVRLRGVGGWAISLKGKAACLITCAVHAQPARWGARRGCDGAVVVRRLDDIVNAIDDGSKVRAKPFHARAAPRYNPGTGTRRCPAPCAVAI